MKRILAVSVGILVGVLSGSPCTAAAIAVKSPDGHLTVSFELKENPAPYAPGQRAYYRVSYRGTAVLNDSPLGLTLTGAKPLNRDFEVVGTKEESHNGTWNNRIGAKRNVPDRYNQVTVSLQERQEPRRRLDVVFRAYNEGAAFRYAVPKQPGMDKFTIQSEDTGFCFAGDVSAFALNMGKFNTHNEGEYPRTPLSKIKPESIINLPLLVEMPGGPWVALLEADLTDYAGMYVGGMPGMANGLRTLIPGTQY
jgi:alpha-glucosidase